MSRFTRFIGLGLTIVMLMALVFGVVSAQDEPIILYDSFGPGDIPGIDPSVNTDTTSIQLVMELFPGLTRLHEVTLEVEPGMATWEVSEDGTLYTFSILPEVPWVFYNQDTGAIEQVMDDEGNPRYVTANDFIYGAQRTLLPETASYYAGVLAPWVVNGAAINAGEMGVEEIGMVAVDDYTLEIQATEAAAFLPNIFGMWMNTAQPAWVIEEFGEGWTEDFAIQSYGPFALKQWLHDESVTIIKNPFWAGTESIPAPQIDEVNFTMLEASAQLANFEAGVLDVSDVPLSDIDRINADPELSQALTVGPGSCTYYYGFNTIKEPVDDARVRRALSMTINRQAIIDNLLKGGQSPAYFFSMPTLVGAPSAEDFPDLVIGEDVEMARAELQSYLDEKGITVDQMTPITLMHNQSEAHAAIAQAIQQMWSESLGINVQIQTQEWAVYLDTVRQDAPQIYRLAWCLDYPDAHNFLWDVFHSATDPDINWSNPEFDALVDQAKVETDPDVRRELYAQAEYILSNEVAGLAPIYYYTFLNLTQPWVERTYSQIGNEYYEKWSVNLDARP